MSDQVASSRVDILRTIMRQMPRDPDAWDRAARQTEATEAEVGRAFLTRSLTADAETTDAVTVTQAADMLGVNTARIRQLIESKRLSGRKVGHMWLVTRASIEDYGATRRVLTPRQPISAT